MRTEEEIRKKLEEWELVAESIHTMPDDIAEMTRKIISVLKWVLYKE